MLESQESRILRVKGFLEDPRNGLNMTSLGQKAGISRSVVSAVIHGKYAGDVEGALAKIESVIKNLEDKLRVGFYQPDFVYTKLYHKVERMLDDAVAANIPRITVLYGPSGIGKTECIEHYVKKHAHTVLIKVRSDFNARAVLVKLAGALGVSASGATYELTDRIIERLEGSGRLVIFDEAEYLKPYVLDILRRIFDESKSPVVLIGMNKLYHIISSLRNNFEQIANRMISYSLGTYNSLKGDVELVLREALKDYSDEIQRAFLKEAPGSIRESLLLAQDIVNYSERSGKQITPEFICTYKNTQH